MSLLQDALKRKQEDDKGRPLSAANAIPPAALLPIPPPDGVPSATPKPILAPPPPAPTPPPPPEATMGIPARPAAPLKKETPAWFTLLLSLAILVVLMGSIGYGGWFVWENFIKKKTTAEKTQTPPATPVARPTPSPGSIADRVQKSVAAANQHTAQANQSMTAFDPATPATPAVALPVPPATPAVALPVPPAPVPPPPAPVPVTNLVKVVTITQTVAAAAPPAPPPPPKPGKDIKWPVLKITGAVAAAGKKGFAIVNGDILSEGEEIDGVLLKEVQADRVIVEKDGQLKTLYLGAKKE